MAEERKRQKRVVVFTAPGCVWCTRVKKYLKDHKIRFNEIDVSRDKKAAQDCMKHTGSGGVPVVLIGNRWIAGFDKEKINRELGIK